MGEEYHQALIPLQVDINVSKTKEMFLAHKMIRRGYDNSGGLAIAISTVGNRSLDLLPGKPDPTEDGIRTAMVFILTRVMDIAHGVKVDITGARINIQVKGAKMDYEETLYQRCLGSPIASIAAAVCSESLDKAVRIIEEGKNKGKSKIIIEVIG
jgi:hypothetical protein